MSDPKELKNLHAGSSFEDFLKEEGCYEEVMARVAAQETEELIKSCPRCHGKSANPSNPQGRCSACLKKLAANKKKPGHWQRAQTKFDDAKRRENAKNGTAHYKSKGRVKSRKAFVSKVQNAEKKTGEKLSPDRVDNSRGYEGKNTRMVPEKLNRGRHHVDGKKLRAWQKRLKKTDLTDDQFYTMILAKAQETNDTALLSLLDDMHPNDLVNFINNEDSDVPQD
jgi:hypothetical protein